MNIDGDTVAALQGQLWHAQGAYFTHITCTAPVSIEFHSRSESPESIGPYDVEVRGPAIWANGQIAAVLMADRWGRPGTPTECETIILTEAASPHRP